MAQSDNELEQDSINPDSVEKEPNDELDKDSGEDEGDKLEDDSEDKSNDNEEVEEEAWKGSVSQLSNDSVPVSKHIRVRTKLKAKVAEKSEEIETLKSEIQALKASQTPSRASASNNAPRRPTLEQFDYDETKYTEALDGWYFSQMDERATKIPTV